MCFEKDIMKELIREAIDSFNEDVIKGKKITLGFDGCADVICKVIRNNNNGSTKHIETMTEFSQYIEKMSGLSCSIELDREIRKAGGNSALFANAISECGVKTTIVGMYGRNQIADVFSELAEKCKIYSYNENQLAFSLEFADGKIMIAPKVIIEGDIWQKVVDAVGPDDLEQVFAEPDMLALVNWGELDFSTPLWKSTYDYLAQKRDMDKEIIVDLADCLRRSAEDIGELIKLLEAFATTRTLTLSVNESEAMELGKYLGLDVSDDYGSLCASLASSIKVQRIVLHAARRCYTSECGVISELPTQFNEAPKLLTGGGDNFNAGYTIGRLLGLRGELCNVYGNSMSSYYIMHGKSSDLNGLKDHMEKWYLELQ